MYGYQALPNGERSSELIAGTKFANDGEITVAVRWKNIVENGIDVGSDAPAAGKCFRAALGVRENGAANFGEGLWDSILAQKEISVAPGNIGGKRIGKLGLQKSAAGVWKVAFGFVSSGEVQPGSSGMRIERNCVTKVQDGPSSIGFVKRVLPIAAEEIPIHSVLWLQAGGCFIPGASGEIGVVIRASVADAQVGENQAEEQGEENCGETRRDIRKAQKHSKVLCLEVFGDARLKVTSHSSGEGFIGTAPAPDVDAQALDLLIERRERDHKALGGFGLVPSGALKHIDYDAALDLDRKSVV